MVTDIGHPIPDGFDALGNDFKEVYIDALYHCFEIGMEGWRAVMDCIALELGIVVGILNVAQPPSR